MKSSDQPKPKRQDIYYQYYNTESIESSTGLTGLTPTPPLSDDDAESYSEIYGMPVPDDLPNEE